MTTKIFITASVFNPDTEEEFHGWIDPSWSMFQLHENKEDVAPLEFDPEFDDSIEALIEETIGSIDSTERGNHYGADTPLHDGEYWSYCAHVES